MKHYFETNCLLKIILISLLFLVVSCCYPEQKPTVVWELHLESVNGVAIPEPSPINIDEELKAMPALNFGIRK